MSKEQKELRAQLAEYYEEPIWEKLVLINASESYFGVAAAEKRLLKKCLEENRTVALVMQDMEAFEVGFREELEAENVFAVQPDTVECMRCFATAKEIWSFTWLPYFFAEREGQVVHLLLSETMADQCAYVTQDSLNRARSFHSAAQVDTVLRMLAADKPAEREKDSLLVVLSRENALFQEDFLPLFEFDRALRGQAAVRGLRLQYIVTPDVWHRAMEAGYPMPYDDVVPDTVDITEWYVRAALVVTDFTAGTQLARQWGIPCVCSTGDVMKKENGLVWPSYDNATFANTVVTALEELDRGGALHSAAGATPTEREIPILNKQECPAGLSRQLALMDWDVIGNYSEFLRFWQDNAARDGKWMELLLRSDAKGEVFKHLNEFPENLFVSCRGFGYIASESEQRFVASIAETKWTPDDFEPLLRREWVRMVGSRPYERIYFTEHPDGVWKALERFYPAKELISAGWRKMLEEFGYLFEPTYLRSFVGDDRLLCTAETEDMRYRYLGDMDGKPYFIPDVFQPDDFVLCRYNGMEREFCLDQWEQLKTDKNVLVVLNTNKNHLFVGEEPRVLQIQLLPRVISLLLRCGAFISSEDNTDVMLATWLGIPTFSPAGEHYAETSVERKMRMMENKFWDGAWVWDPAVPKPTEY